MKDEIKEILFIKEQNADYKRLSIDELIKLEDYITSIEQDFERVNNECNKYFDMLMRKQKLLEFEIDRNGEKQEKIDKALVFIDEFYINLSYKEKAIIEVKKILQGEDKK